MDERLYTTIGDVVSQYVRPALAEYADEYDCEAIAREITVYEDGEEMEDQPGWIWVSPYTVGYRVTLDHEDWDAFMAIASRHEIAPATD